MKPKIPAKGIGTSVALADTAGTTPMLRLLVCGSDRSGKSTLVNRLVAENNSAADDQQRMTAVAPLPGLPSAGTPEVACRHFHSATRSFIAAAVPDGGQEALGMVSGAANADLAIVVIDAGEGMLPQDFQQSIIASLFRIRHVVLAVNKLDLDNFNQAGFAAIRRKFEDFTASLGFATRQVIPVSARDGDNVSSKSARTPWYDGPSLLQHLETVDIDHDNALPTHQPQLSDQVAAHLIWLSDEDLLPGRSYLMRTGARTIPAIVSELKHKLAIDSPAKLAAKTLARDEIGFCNLAIASPIAFEPYNKNHETGLFVLTDRFTGTAAAVGFIEFGLRRATNLHYQHLAVSKQARALLKHQRPAILWFTGLPAAGKSTVANMVESRLHAHGVHTLMLDGDNVRHGLNKDLGFTEADRVENIRRVGEVAKLMVDAGLIVLCSFISPFRAERQMVRELVDAGEFIEVFVDTPLEQCIARDPKGLYRRAMAGEIANFTGISQQYEPPDNAEIHLLASKETPEALASRVIDELAHRGICDTRPNRV